MSVEDKKDNSVYVRKRPLTSAESRRGETDVVTALSGECVIATNAKKLWISHSTFYR